jgi:two-component system response regulator AtoC
MIRARNTETAHRASGILTTVRPSQADARLNGLFITVVGPEGFSAVSLPSQGGLLIGRGAEAEVRISDPLASRAHCRLHVTDGVVEAEDLGSANGTHLRNQALQPGIRVPLVPGDALSIGATLLMLRSGGQLPRAVRVLPHGYFLARLDEECVSAARDRAPFALVRLDVEGEISTSRCAGLLPAILQPSDIIGAYGPRQYELLLPRATPDATTTLLADLAASFSKAGIKCRTGVAHHPNDGRAGAELLERACERVRPAAVQSATVSDIILVDPAMRDLHRLARDAAQSNVCVLIVGETGTGKEILAEVVHRASARAGKELLSLNCAAVPENLIEAELFGYEKNAFTGASQTKPGLLETAPGGTVFLDEIGELPYSLQAKLLRVLDTRTLIRVGGIAKRTVDVRFVSATNRNLQRAIAAGQFRSDLYFRLNGITLALPPLRERHLEIEPFAQRFAGEIARELDRLTPTISADSLALLRAYAWPGNIRELRNVIHRAVLLCAQGAAITPDHLPRELMEATFTAPAPPPAVPLDRAPLSDTDPGLPIVGAEERLRVLDALAQTAGNQTAAAKLLGMSRTAFVGRLNLYGISRPRKKQSPRWRP